MRGFPFLATAMIKKACMLLSVAAAFPLAAQTSSRQLHEFAVEAEAFNRNDPYANVFRAGYYNGFLSGTLDTLQGRTVCFKACPCELEKLVRQHLDDHPEVFEQPASRWLVPLLEATYPCH
jgi:hypothetical protein